MRLRNFLDRLYKRQKVLTGEKRCFIQIQSCAEFYSNKKNTKDNNTLTKFAEDSLEEEDGTLVNNLLRTELVNCKPIFRLLPCKYIIRRGDSQERACR